MESTIMVTMFMPIDEFIARHPVVQQPQTEIVQIQPGVSVYGPHPVITSMRQERSMSMGFNQVETKPKKQKKQKEPMTYQKAVEKVINLRVENDHLGKTLHKLDSCEKTNVKRIAKITATIHKNREKIDRLVRQFNIKEKDFQTETTWQRIMRRTKEGWKSFWKGVGDWINANKAPLITVGLTALAIIGIVL